MDVADRSGVIDFAWELPEGLHSRIDKKGSGLSNAQKQCIEIARKMLKYGC
jgi:ATP-binding cassette subfamily B protein